MLKKVLSEVIRNVVRGVIRTDTEVPPPPGFNPADMFTPTTPGWVYDLSDFSTLFQDSAGTTPVTAVEQPVGLVLDKSQGLVLGPELLVNGDFSDGVAGWIATNCMLESKPGGVARLTVIADGNAGITQSVAHVSGSSFILGFNILSGSSPSMQGYVGGQMVAAGDYVGPIGPSFLPINTGYRGVYFSVPAMTGLVNDEIGVDVRIYDSYAAPKAGDWVEYQTFTIKSLAGNHASQPTTTKRPVLKVDGTGHYYLKGDGVDDFESTAAIDFTGADSVTTWTGVQKLQDATRGILYELGTDTNTVNGTFGSNAPDTDGGTGFWFVSRGTSRATAVVSGYPSPYKAVLTARGRISTDTCSIQVNLDSPASTGADQGINAYISAPAYFGARAGTSLFFNGQLYSSVCLGRVATDEEVDNTRGWVNDRTGAY